MLWVALHFNAPLSGTLENLAAWACQFTPRVSLEPPQALLAEMQGGLRCFSGLDSFLGKLRAGLAELGFDAAIATAATPRAALWRARSNQENLENVPVSATGFETGFLESIGISKIGELLQLPREGLAKRCGEALLKELDQALGAIPEPRAFFAPPPCFAAALELPGEVAHAEGLLFAARRLLLQLQGLTTQPDHRPEHAWRRVEQGEWDPRQFRQPGPRPAWLLEAPRRLGQMDCELLAGPERIECGWWDGDEAKRDYFIARSGCSLIWVYRESGNWYLHGIFA